MTAEEARERVTYVRRLLTSAMRMLSVPRPDLALAGIVLDWAATLCMELARDCRRESEHEGRDWVEDGDR